jgi:hypothetical protein
LTSQAVNYATATKGKLRGLQVGVAVIPALVSETVAPSARQAAERRSPKASAAFVLPAIVAPTINRTYYYRGRVVLGLDVRTMVARATPPNLGRSREFEFVTDHPEPQRISGWRTLMLLAAPPVKPRRGCPLSMNASRGCAVVGALTSQRPRRALESRSARPRVNEALQQQRPGCCDDCNHRIAALGTSAAPSWSGVRSVAPGAVKTPEHDPGCHSEVRNVTRPCDVGA